MRTLIIQYYINVNLYDLPKYNNLTPSPIEKYSQYAFEQYAKKYNIEFRRVTQPKLRWKHPTWERMDLWTDKSWWDRYDQICYVDSDIIPLPWAGNIFEQFKDLDAFKVCDYMRFSNNTAQGCKEKVNNNTLMNNISGEQIKAKGFQPGLFILSKKSAEVMRPYVKEFTLQPDNIDDGMLLNWAAIVSNVVVEKMPEAYNRKNNGETINLKTLNFLHCAGGKKHKPTSKVFKMMKEIYPEVVISW